MKSRDDNMKENGYDVDSDLYFDDIAEIHKQFYGRGYLRMNEQVFMDHIMLMLEYNSFVEVYEVVKGASEYAKKKRIF